MNWLATNSRKENDIFNELGYIMKHTLNAEMYALINIFFSEFIDEQNSLDYFQKIGLLITRFVSAQTLSSDSYFLFHKDDMLGIT